jgi:penicillin-binding protein 1A
VFLYFSNDLPDLQNLKTEIRNPAVIIQTYNGKIIGSYGDLYEDVIKINDLPKYVPITFMAIEDKRFFSHFGVDIVGFFRAIYKNYISGKIVQGGSTITQQLAKNILITEGKVTHYDRTIARKIKELLLAFWLEYKFTKTDILMMYLNRVYFGAGTYGIDAAARKYFNKSSKNLTIFESAILSGLLKAPSKYNPANQPNYAHDRAMIVLKAMEEQGYIKSAAEIERTQGSSTFSTEKKPSRNCMYFCDYVYEQAQKILGYIADDIIVVTTLDEQKQAYAEEAVEYYIKTEGANYKFKQAAFICLNRNGAVLAMVGGNGYSATQFNRAVQASRMAGSAFKIFVYGAALEYGYQLTDMISDAPIKIAGWEPRNYKWKTRGQISILNGFVYSVNAISIRLAQAIGLKNVARFAKKLGIYDVSNNDMSVALGTTAVTLKDLTAAYTTFMDGKPIWTNCIVEIRTRSGEVLYHDTKALAKDSEQKNKEYIAPVIDKEVLSLARAMLRDVVKRGTGRASNKNEYIYGKTGSNGDSDAWFFGFYDPTEARQDGFSVGVWIGNDSNVEKMTSNSTGGRIPARIARKFFDSVIVEENNQKPKEDINKTEQRKLIPKNKGLGSLLGL